MPEAKVVCPHCKKDFNQTIILIGAVDEIGFTCMNDACKKRFKYKVINGKWRLLKDKPKKLQEVERFGSFEL